MKALLVGIVLAVATPAAAQPSLVDQKFLKAVSGGARAEIERGQLALDKASSPEVKAFAQRMIDDHGKAKAKLDAVLAAQGVRVSPTLPADAKRSYEKLAKLDGAAFDRAYIQDMLDDHRKDVKLFEDQARNGNDPALRQYAEATLPTLRDHLQEVERLAKR